MRYQLRYIRVPRARSSPVAKDDDSPRERGYTNPVVDPFRPPQNISYPSRDSVNPERWRKSRHVIPDWVLSHWKGPEEIESP